MSYITEIADSLADQLGYSRDDHKAYEKIRGVLEEVGVFFYQKGLEDGARQASAAPSIPQLPLFEAEEE